MSTQIQEHWDYSTDTEGLPKTDFNVMAVQSSEIVSMIFDIGSDVAADIKQHFQTEAGTHAGGYLVHECENFEYLVKQQEFNVLHYSGLMQNATRRMAAILIAAYQLRLQIRKLLADPDNITLEESLKLHPQALNDLAHGCVDIAVAKDREYGASWCIRGGIGAWFTTVRKFDRIINQLKLVENNLWDIRGDVNSTEALEETLLDAVNYLLLIEEKRTVIQERIA